MPPRGGGARGLR